MEKLAGASLDGQLGFNLPVAATRLEATDFAQLDVAAKVPYIKPTVQAEGYANFCWPTCRVHSQSHRKVRGRGVLVLMRWKLR